MGTSPGRPDARVLSHFSHLSELGCLGDGLMSTDHHRVTVEDDGPLGGRGLKVFMAVVAIEKQNSQQTK